MTDEEKKQVESLQLEIKRLRGLKKTLRRNFQDMVGLLTTTISQTNNFLGGHIKRVSILAKSFSGYMRYDKDTIYRIYYGALLHDIGMVGYPGKLISSSASGFSESDLALFKKHPLIGEKMISSAYDLRQTAQIIRSHHEEFSGDGFPDGLAGSEIPLGARITRLANDYDNFIYKDKIKAAEAAGRIKERSGYIYDPKLATYFIKFIKTNVEKQDHSSEPSGIKLSELSTGMYIAEDINLENGMLLIPKGVILDDFMLQKIQSFESLLNMDMIVSVVS
ncbi:MAG: HD domain-containing protein [Spirochaetales bacterium]|uniref:HD domain-containing protein n=1 Tax=Candidatus Thalassospirochaeta sargassi TaxID=3119039 RepID=A0AAJ1IDQ3_9SPIO|nr:HD domain-containing protein [Spirochaetales bacterium]